MIPLSKHCSVALLCVLSVLALCRAVDNEAKVVQLNVLFRHGDRAPEAFPKRFPNDPHTSDSFYPMASGGLLNIGKQRMYRFGQALRENYSDLLGRQYVEENVYAVSSSTSRTKMSLQLVLAALYPPSLMADDRWNEQLDWQPFAIFYKQMRESMLFDGDKCEWYTDEFERILNSTEVQSELDEYKDYLEDLRVRVGKKSRITLNDVLLLHNNLDIEQRMNLHMEPWMLETLADVRLKKLRQLYYEIHGYNVRLRRLQAGTLMRQISENLQRRARDDEKTPIVTLFSGHDKNIIGLLQLLDAYDLHFPEFGSALIFELLHRNQQYYVKILHFLGIPNETKTIALPGCESPCPLDKFIALTKDSQITDEELECKINDESYFGEDD